MESFSLVVLRLYIHTKEMFLMIHATVVWGKPQAMCPPSSWKHPETLHTPRTVGNVLSSLL